MIMYTYAGMPSGWLEFGLALEILHRMYAIRKSGMWISFLILHIIVHSNRTICQRSHFPPFFYLEGRGTGTCLSKIVSLDLITPRTANIRDNTAGVRSARYRGQLAPKSFL